MLVLLCHPPWRRGALIAGGGGRRHIGASDKVEVTVQRSHLTLVDLAGSERVSKSGSKVRMWRMDGRRIATART